ncbi:MAG TPA: ATP synthase F1 subunit gamma [Rubrobacteraceae bacterium]|nr:ATP synthase F1 subunit gamma [Rubrobacteraceae bacterium]
MSLQDMKRQIQSVDNTAKMTGAMQTISAVKLSRARERLDRIRPYTDNMQQMMQDIASKAGGNNPLLAGREEVRNVAVCTVTSDRGLAGPFNAQVLRQTMQFRQEQDADIVQVVTGRKAVEFFRFGRISVEEAFTGFSDQPSFEKAQEIGRYLTRLFEDEEADEVHLVYNQFKSALVQQPTVTRLLPAAPEGTDEEDDEEDGEGEERGNPFEFIPDAETILERLVPKYVETLVFRALFESAAGEHGSRMSAMKSATDAANEMSEDLKQQMNKARQAAITAEIIEIAAAAEALGG